MLPALGLGDDPGVPRLARRHRQGRELHPVHADGVADDLRDGPRGGQDPPGHQRRAEGDAAAPARGNGRRTLRLLDPAAGPRFGAVRLRRHADGHRHHGRRRHLQPGRGAARARRGLHPDHAADRRPQGRPRRPRLPGPPGRGGPAAGAAQRGLGQPGRPDHPPAAPRVAGGVPAQRSTGVRPGRDDPDRFVFTLEDWNLYDASPAWREATVGDRDERLRKMADPALRERIKQETQSASALFTQIQGGRRRPAPQARGPGRGRPRRATSATSAARSRTSAGTRTATTSTSCWTWPSAPS